MTSNTPSSRLHSLDALRGLDMLMIAGLEPVLIALFRLCGGSPNSPWLQQFRHVEWNGLLFQDTIFALFLFIAGVSFPFSCAKRRAAGAGSGALAANAVRRGAILFLLGLVYNGLLTLDFKNLVWGSVLGRIGAAWTIAALVYIFASLRVRLGTMAGILAGYWACTFLLHAPDFPAADVLSPQGNFACYLDRLLMPGKLTVAGVYTNQGLVGTLSAAVTALLGMCAGDLLRSDRVGERAKTWGLVAGALWLAGLGIFVAYACGRWSFPINKKLWSPSFVLVVGGYSAAMLALFHWIVDVRGHVRATTVLRVVGLNSITVYLLVRFVPFGDIAHKLVGGVAGLFPPAGASLVQALGSLALVWLVLYFLHRHKVYLKV